MLGGSGMIVAEVFGGGLEGRSAPGILEDMLVLLMNLPHWSQGGRLSVHGFM
jgi:hypothetical protein